MPKFLFGIVGVLFFAAAAQAASPGEGVPITVDVSSLRELKQAIERATPGSVIRLAAGTYSMFADDAPIRMKGVRGLPDQPIVIQGALGAAGARPTIIDGGRSLDGVLGMVERVRRPGGRPRELEEVIEENEFRTRQAVNCLVFDDAAYLIIEELTIRNCWPTGVVFRSSHHVTLRGNTIVGSTYPFFVDSRSDHFVVENSIWTQDDSGYAADESGYSGRYDPRPRPGRMWDTLPWGVSHHGSRAYLNGSLIFSFGTRGDIVIRHNIVRNAYNAVRLRADRCEEPQCNVNVEVYDNDFEFIRDNPIEPEDQASNWWIYHNRIYNAHAWFSLDGIGGGPVYIFGNTGWFDDKPSRRCIPAQWAADRTLQADGTYAPTAQNECSHSRTGKVVKLGPGEVELKEPIYVFSNSWYVRAPVVDGGRSKFRAWDNATLFCEPTAVAPGMCMADFETEKRCVQSPPGMAEPVPNRFPIDLDRVPFIDCFAGSPGDESTHGISNHPDFPDKLAEVGYPVRGVHGDPGFVNGPKGDFRLRPDSLARGKGCTVARTADGSLTCQSSAAGTNPDIGAYQGDRLIDGPDYLDRGDEQPRVIKATWRSSSDPPLLEIAFSTVMRISSSGIRMALRFDHGSTAYSERCESARGVALVCRFPTLHAPPDAAATLLVPRSLASTTGRPITLWASGVPRVAYQR